MLAKRLIHGLSLSMDSEEAMINKLKVKAKLNINKEFSVLLPFFLYYLSVQISPFLFISTASVWLRVHKQTPQNVHRHERERRPQQQVQQFHQDAGDGGGPGHQLPDLRITGGD